MEKKQLLKIIHTAIRASNETYCSWSGGNFLSEAALEGFMVANMANAIMRHERHPAYLCLEYSIDGLKDAAGRRPCGRVAPRMTNQGRVDIALFNGSDYVTHIIEAKCQRTWSSACTDDLERLANVQRHLGNHHKESSLKLSILALFAHSYSTRSRERAFANLDMLLTGWKQRATKYCQKKQDIIFEFDCSALPPFEFNDERSKEFHIASSMCIIIKSA